MPTKYTDTLSPQVIYVFRVCDETHAGCLKVGMTKLTGTHPNIFALTDMCQELQDIAKTRINEYTGTAAVPYELLHAELSLFIKDGHPASFDDHQVHEILLRSGIKKKDFTFTDKAKEWFITDLQTVRNAITAAKEGRKALSASEMSFDKSPIEFRPEQRNAIDQSVRKFQIPGTRMLWNCKMRFGKTLSALQVVKEMQFYKTIIVTHRPVVDAGWFEDFDKIFYDQPDFRYGSKNNGETFDTLISDTKPFIYFASIQDLRGSSEVGGKFDKNNIIFQTKWNLVIVDEAHEGTQTELGQKVLKALIKKHTCTIDLSGTPFNIVSDYNEDEIVNWTYVDEQREKENWAKEHPCDYNPYGGLPHMNMAIYDLNDVFEGYEATEGDVQFNFAEFFRTWSGNAQKDHRRMPQGAVEGEFVHKQDVSRFLDMLVKPDASSNYPFSTEEYRNIFRHTFWVVPGVAAAKALSAMLKLHPVFSQFDIVNVAGDGDEDAENEEALEAVNKAIGDHPENTYTITISCGRLTTGVSVKAWTAVFMLYGSTKTKAQGYMQTIFRVQTPAIIGGKRKEECYVFDFAPDRIVGAIDETIRAASYAKKGKPGTQKETVTDDEREDFQEFLHYCSVIAYDGSQMRPYDVTKLLEHLKRVQIERVVRNGFEDPALYNNDILMNLDADNIEELQGVKGIIGTSKAQKPMGDFVVNDQGLDSGETGEKPNKNPKKPLSPEDEAKKKELAKKKKQKQDAMSILRGISIRFPMLIYGADVKDESEGITLDNFTSFIDKESWAEFMPQGISMQKFYALRKYYDPDVFNACGKRIRAKAKAADSLPPLERIKRITDIFSTFRNPDKETVLTPWRVVNMHLSDTIGGYDFFDETHNLSLSEPRLVEHGKTTWKIFEKDNPHILEINSKSGLYPLYMTYTLFRKRLEQWKAMELLEDAEHPSLEEQQMVWDDVITHNIFVLCKTPMAAKITKRTLVGFRDVTVRARHIDNLIEEIQDNQEKVIKKLRQGKAFWHAKHETDMIQFDAVVGNPPYQVMDGGAGASASPIYQYFVDLSKRIKPNAVSLIMPAKWYSGGKGLDSFRTEMLNDTHIESLFDYTDSRDCFPTADIAGGICYYLWELDYNGLCTYTNNIKGVKSHSIRKLNEYDIFIRYPKACEIVRKVLSKSESNMGLQVSARKPFGLATNITPLKSGDIRLRYTGGIGPYDSKLIKTGSEMISKWKVMLSYLSAEHAGQPDKSGRFRILSTTDILAPNVVCTETYLIAGYYETEEEANNLLAYLKTKFIRFLIGQIAVGQHITRNCFQFVPIQDFTRPWTDADLYKKYNLSSEEVAYIESLIKPMDAPAKEEEKPQEVKIEIHNHIEHTDNIDLHGNIEGDVLTDNATKIVKE